MEPFNKKNIDQLNFLNNHLKSNSIKVKNEFNKSGDEKNKYQNKDNLINSILIVDTETTGLDENKNQLIEIGCILFNIPAKEVLSQISFLLPVSINEAENINGISPEMTQISQPWEDAISFFYKLVDCCDYIVAHNVEFDKKWFGIGKLRTLDKKWICSLDDINWSFKEKVKRRPSVTDLALAFGVPVWNLHRALSDCFYLSEVFKKCENLEDLLIDASKPRYLYKAIVSYEDRLLAKEAGFRWNNPVQGAWTKRLSENEAVNLNFKVEILN